MANTPLGYCPCHPSKHTRQFLNFALMKNSDELERRRLSFLKKKKKEEEEEEEEKTLGCLVVYFK